MLYVLQVQYLFFIAAVNLSRALPVAFPLPAADWVAERQPKRPVRHGPPRSADFAEAVTGGGVIGGQRLQLGSALPAHRLGEGAAGVEGAAGRHGDGRGRLARERRRCGERARLELWRGRQERARVGVSGGGEDALRHALLDDPAEVHDGDAAAHALHDREVVADEQIGEPELAPERVEQAEHGGLNGKIEPGRRLVEDDDARMQHEDARQPHAALLAA